MLLALPAGVAAQTAPDLVVHGPLQDDSTREPGETFRILVTVQNLGTESSMATTVRFYRSTDTTITTSDTEEGTAPVGPLGHLGGSGRTILLTAPSTGGTYYYGACVDVVAGELDTTNNCSSNVTRVDVSEPTTGGGDGDGGGDGTGDDETGDDGAGDDGTGDDETGAGDDGTGDDETPVNTAPVAVDDVVETPEDTPVTIAVLANDSDPDGDTLAVVDASAPAHGTARVTGAGAVIYTPEPDFNGSDRFTYTVRDRPGLTARADVRVTVLPVDDAPLAVDDAAETPEDTPVTIVVLANDSDPDGDTLAVVDATAPAHGTTRVTGAGAVEYRPEPDYHGSDRFAYVVGDGTGLTARAAVEVTVLPVNDPPLPTVRHPRPDPGGWRRAGVARPGPVL